MIRLYPLIIGEDTLSDEVDLEVRAFEDSTQ